MEISKSDQTAARKEVDHGWGYSKDGKAITAEVLHKEADRRGIRVTDSVQLDLIAYELNGNKARDEAQRQEYHRSMEPTRAAVRAAENEYSKSRSQDGNGVSQDRMKAVVSRAVATMKQQRERSQDSGRGL